MDEVFQRLYDREINFVISTFWDGGFDVKIGDGLNGYRAETTVETWAEVGPWLETAAREHYSDHGYS